MWVFPIDIAGLLPMQGLLLIYVVLVQGRQAELEMQLKHGKEGPEEVQYKQFTAWLW